MDIKKRKILFIGGYRGIKNLGDHAMALNIIEQMRAKVKNITFTILVNDFNDPLDSQDIEYRYTFFRKMGKFRKALNTFRIGELLDEFFQLTKSFYIILNAWFYKQLRFFILIPKEFKSTIIELSKSDMIWFGGGGHINDIATISGVYGTTILCILARIFKKEVIMTGQGFGPLKKKINRKLLSIVLPKVKFIGLRDYSESKNILKSIGVPDNKIILVGDDAASLQLVDDGRISEILYKENIKLQGMTFGVQFRKTNYTKEYNDNEIKKIASILDYIVDTFNIRILFIPTNYDKSIDDRDAEFQIFKKMINKQEVDFVLGEYGPNEIKSIIGKLDFFLGFSYHPLVFALTQAVPTICFYNNEYYSLKNRGLFEWFGLSEFAMDLDSFNNEDFKNIANKLIKDDRNIREILREKTREMALRLDTLLDKIQGILIPATPLKILFYESGPGFGGSSSALVHMLNSLDRNNLMPIVIVKNLGEKVKALNDMEVIKFKDYRDEPDKISNFRFLFYFFRDIIPEAIRLYFISRAKKITLVHINTNITLGIPAILAAKLLRIPCVCHIRETRKLIKREKFFSKWVDKFIVLNNDAFGLYKRDIPENKISIIFDGLTLEGRKIKEGGDFRKEFNLNSNPVIGAIGRIVSGKGQREFVLSAKEVLKLRPQVKFAIVGDAKSSHSNAYYEEVLNLVRDEGLRNDIIFTGWRNDVNNIIADLDILVLPSTTFPEGLPNVIIEAMALKKPVIATDIPGPRDIVVNGETGFLVPPGNINVMAEKIIYLLDNPEISRKMGEQGRKRAEELFDIKKQVKKIEAVYEELFNR